MQRLILASNRLPVTVNKNKDGEFNFQQSSGGLATGLSSVYQEYEGFWMGWPGISDENLSKEEKKKLTHKLKKEYNNHPIFLSQDELNNYYYGFCNRTIWPLFHYFTRYTHYLEKFWQEYKKINYKFFNHLKTELKNGDNLWIHDYQLMLLPELVRKEFPDVKIGFFLHIPFPSFEIFRLLPWREEILRGLLGADLIGFHTYGYVRHFLSSVLRILGYEKDFNEVLLENRSVKVDLFPMGIDYKKFSNTPDTEKVQDEIANLKKLSGKTKIILSVDRLDYTKGVPERLKAFEYFLEQNPQYQGKVTMVMIAVPSRTKIEKYEELKIEVNRLVGDINGKYGTLEWVPVRYLFQSIPFEKLIALYNYADICLVTPLRDGMNLVSKEFVAASDDKGVLILSEMAGSTYELSGAITITPTRKEEIAQSILEALKMDQKEQKNRLQSMQKRIKNYDVEKWAHSFVKSLVSSRKIEDNNYQYNQKNVEIIFNKYKKKKKRLLIFDYDIINKEELSHYNKQIKKVSRDERNSLFILSAYSREWMTRIFGKTDAFILAEYGDYFYNGKKWNPLKQIDRSWMKDILPIIQLHKENTPGAFIEKRNNSIRWYYQGSEPELAQLRKKELKDTLTYFSKEVNLNIVEARGFLEVKTSTIIINELISNIFKTNNFDFSLMAGNLNRYPDINKELTDNPVILEINSSRLNESYKLKKEKQFLEMLHYLAEI